MTNLANESCVNAVLKELMTYVKHNNKDFVSATVHAIGNIAFRMPEVADSCLHSVMILLTSESSTVVTEAVLVIKNILQSHESCRALAVPALAHKLPDMKAAAARSSLIWILGEYEEIIHDYVPDILRVLAKDFGNEDSAAKLQILNMAVKVYLKNPGNQTVQSLMEYILSLCKYDTSYDIRDKARLVRAVLMSQSGGEQLRSRAHDLFLASKPMPVLLSAMEKNSYLCGSLAHSVNQSTPGYIALDDFSAQVQNAEARNDKEEVIVQGPISSAGVVQTTSAPAGKTADVAEDLEEFYASDHGSESEGEGSESSYSSSYSESGSESEGSEGSASESEQEVVKPAPVQSKPVQSVPVSKKPQSSQPASKDLEMLASPKVDIMVVRGM